MGLESLGSLDLPLDIPLVRIWTGGSVLGNSPVQTVLARILVSQPSPLPSLAIRHGLQSSQTSVPSGTAREVQDLETQEGPFCPLLSSLMTRVPSQDGSWRTGL